MSSFLVTWFSNLNIFVELWIDYQPAKFQRCILSLASFIDREKHNDDIIMTSFHVLGIGKSQILLN